MVTALVGFTTSSEGLRMNRYQLAKIVDWVGTFRSRKRMQKLSFTLQAAGCPLDAEYELHPYGPYSDDVARLTGELGSVQDCSLRRRNRILEASCIRTRFR